MLITLFGIAVAIAFTSMTTSAADSTSAKKGKLRHVVAFKFKETATQDDIKKVETAFRDLKKKIKEIQSYEWGINNSTEGHNKGCTHGFILTFNNEKDRDVYLKHPDHQAFGKLVGPLLGEVFVIDFFAQD
jgi:hypothetical protein